jgi:hypothetical protein
MMDREAATSEFPAHAVMENRKENNMYGLLTPNHVDASAEFHRRAALPPPRALRRTRRPTNAVFANPMVSGKRPNLECSSVVTVSMVN